MKNKEKLTDEELIYCRNMLRNRRTLLNIQAKPKMDESAERCKAYNAQIDMIDCILHKIKLLTAIFPSKPSKESAEAMKELEEGKGQSFETIDEFMDDLNNDDKL